MVAWPNRKTGARPLHLSDRRQRLLEPVAHSAGDRSDANCQPRSCSDAVEPEGVAPGQLAHSVELHQPVTEPPRGAIGPERCQRRWSHSVPAQKQRHSLIGSLRPELWRDLFQARRTAGKISGLTCCLGCSRQDRPMTGQTQLLTRLPQIGPLETRREERQDMTPPELSLYPY